MDAIAVAGLVVGIISAIAACFAAWYAKSGLKEQRSAAAESARRHENSIQPRVNITLNKGGFYWSNPGGAALAYLYVGIFDRDVYVYCRPMPAQTSAPGQLSIVPQTKVTTDYSGVVCSIAKDADGDWWDLVTGMRLRERRQIPLGSMRS